MKSHLPPQALGNPLTPNSAGSGGTSRRQKIVVGSIMLLSLAAGVLIASAPAAISRVAITALEAVVMPLAVISVGARGFLSFREGQPALGTWELILALLLLLLTLPAWGRFAELL